LYLSMAFFPSELDEYLDRCVYELKFDYDAVSAHFMARALDFIRHPFAEEPDEMVLARASEIFASPRLKERWEQRHGMWEVTAPASEWEMVESKDLRTDEWCLVSASAGSDGEEAADDIRRIRHNSVFPSSALENPAAEDAVAEQAAAGADPSGATSVASKLAWLCGLEPSAIQAILRGPHLTDLPAEETSSDDEPIFFKDQRIARLCENEAKKAS
jgi:hypothetical protein